MVSSNLLHDRARVRLLFVLDSSGGSSYSSMSSIEPLLWLDLVLRSTEDGTPPWLKEIKKAVALAHFCML